MSYKAIETRPGGAADASQVAALAPDLVLVDGYEFEESFFDALSAHGNAHVVLDDNGETQAKRPAVVINQNPNARPELYAHLGAAVTLLLGLEYALLRPDIGSLRAALLPPSQRAGVFLTLGGSDPLGATFPIASALDAARVPVRVAVGPAVNKRQVLFQRLRALELAEIVRPLRFPSELATSAIALISAGTTMWEVAYLGVPAVGIVIADNQAAPAEAAGKIGFLYPIDCRHSLDADAVVNAALELLGDSERLEWMSLRGRSAVDAYGPARVADVISRRWPLQRPW